MRFVAAHISFSRVEDGWVLALADSVDGTGPTHILVSFGKEGEQDRALGLTGLFVATSWSGERGYGFIERLDFDGAMLTILGCNGHEDVIVEIATQTMSQDEISEVVDLCNQANATKPEKAA